MGIPIALTAPGIMIEGEIEEAPCGIAVIAGFPMEGRVEVWGGEISVRTPVRRSADSSAAFTLQIGDIGYCPSAGTIVVYFDNTPLSSDFVPVARYLVNKIGCITDGIEQFERLRSGMTLRFSWA